MKRDKHIHTLFISYDGYGEPYLESLFLPILSGLSQNGIKVTVLEFCPRNHPSRPRIRDFCARNGIKVRFLPYHNEPSPLATLVDVIAGMVYTSWMVLRAGVNVLHPRSHVPGIMALAAKRILPIKLIFDMDGMMPDERVDWGAWKRDSMLYKLMKKMEELIIINSDAVIVRTEAAKRIFENSFGSHDVTIGVIQNTRDLNKLALLPDERKNLREKLGLSNRLVLAYIGSIAAHYKPFEMARFFKALKRSVASAFFLILTASGVQRIQEILHKEGVSEADYMIRSVEPDDVPRYLAAGDVGISFRENSFSQKGVSPIKICEYLACSLPVIANRGVGDLDEVFQDGEAGFLLDGFNAEQYERAVSWVLQAVKERKSTSKKCRELALKWFSLDDGIAKYKGIYRF